MCKMIFSFNELASVETLARRVASSANLAVETDTALDALRKLSGTRGILVNEDRQEVSYEIPEGYYIEVSDVLIKHVDTIVPLIVSLVSLVKSLQGLFGALLLDLKKIKI